jgi:hypothetical protein
VDPITKQYPELTPFQFASNKPISAVDIDGLEAWEITSVRDRLRMDATMLRIYNPVEDAIRKGLANPEILKSDIHGTGVSGKKDVVERNIASVKRQHDVAIADNIASGPGGAIGYLIGGDRGSAVGAAFDQIGFSFSGIPEQSGYLSKPNFKKWVEYVPNTTSVIAQRVSVKETWLPTEGFSLGYSLQNGKINLSGRYKTHGTFDFVVTQDGKLVIGSKHFHLSNKASSVQAAGTIRIFDGQIREIDNNSGYYKPNEAETANFGTILRNAGVDVSGAKLHTLDKDGNKIKTIRL